MPKAYALGVFGSWIVPGAVVWARRSPLREQRGVLAVEDADGVVPPAGLDGLGHRGAVPAVVDLEGQAVTGEVEGESAAPTCRTRQRLDGLGDGRVVAERALDGEPVDDLVPLLGDVHADAGLEAVELHRHGVDRLVLDEDRLREGSGGQSLGSFVDHTTFEVDVDDVGLGDRGGGSGEVALPDLRHLLGVQRIAVDASRRDRTGHRGAKSVGIGGRPPAHGEPVGARVVRQLGRVTRRGGTALLPVDVQTDRRSVPHPDGVVPLAGLQRGSHRSIARAVVHLEAERGAVQVEGEAAAPAGGARQRVRAGHGPVVPEDAFEGEAITHRIPLLREVVADDVVDAVGGQDRPRELIVLGELEVAMRLHGKSLGTLRGRPVREVDVEDVGQRCAHLRSCGGGDAHQRGQHRSDERCECARGSGSASRSYGHGASSWSGRHCPSGAFQPEVTRSRPVPKPCVHPW